MARYEITSTETGVVLGAYEAASESDAILAHYRDVGGAPYLRLVEVRRGEVVYVGDPEVDPVLDPSDLRVEELPEPPAGPVQWSRLTITGPDGRTEVRWASDVVEALREFRQHGGLDARFFGRMGYAHEDGADPSTWGPASPDDVDWAGFDAYATAVDEEDRPAGGVALCGATGCGRPVYASDLCEPHYRRALRGSSSTAPVRERGTEPLRALSLRVPESVHKALGPEPAAAARRVLEDWARSRA